MSDSEQQTSYEWHAKLGS